MSSVTSLVSSKRAHFLLYSSSVLLRFRNNTDELYSARCGQLRYVFCGFSLIFTIFTRVYCYFSLMLSVTSLVPSKRAHYIVSPGWFFVWKTKGRPGETRTMWSVTLRLLWFLSPFTHFTVSFVMVCFSLMPSVTSLVSSKRAYYISLHCSFSWPSEN